MPSKNPFNDYKKEELQYEIRLLYEIVIRQMEVIKTLHERILKCERSYRELEKRKIEELLTTHKFEKYDNSYR